MYWEAKKGAELINNFALLETAETASLRPSLLDTQRLSETNIKTEPAFMASQKFGSESNLIKMRFL